MHSVLNLQRLLQQLLGHLIEQLLRQVLLHLRRSIVVLRLFSFINRLFVVSFNV